jgi:thiosulfate/3-mercaptopyruvate sulfurtransferase
MTEHDSPLQLPPIVSPEWVLRRMAEGDEHLVLADVRWYLDGRSGRAAYEDAHIPGALFVDMDTDLSDHSQPATAGRHPLPDAEHFAVAMGRLGIGDHSTVIAYDDSGGATAGRLVVMLRAIGRHAALLDGGLKVWPGSTESGSGVVRPAARFTPASWPRERFVTAEEVAHAAQSPVMTVLDARSGDRYRGETEPVDPRAGHIPGARNAPWGANLDPTTGRFKEPMALRIGFESLGVVDAASTVCYCGSGVSACADVLAIEHAGLGMPALFVPSWSGWSSDPGRPVATGAD